jgi:nucleotide-binding universal stress UspA family protein
MLAVHVFSPPLALRTAFPQYAGSMLDSRERTRLLDELDQAVAFARERGTTVGVRVREGDIIEEIVEAAESARSDLIVMGTHGRTGLSRLVLGSVTEKVLQRASCPVLTVPPAAADTPSSVQPRLERILCCLDFSKESIAALHYALALSQQTHGTVSVLHVFEWSAEDVRFVTKAVDAEALRERHSAEARARLEAALPGDDAMRNRVSEVIVAHGKPYAEILRRAEDAHIDLIVIGVGHRSGLERIVGSTTDRVVRAASCPVLAVRQWSGV